VTSRAALVATFQFHELESKLELLEAPSDAGSSR
jgi:hypothetical protein